MWKSFNLDRIGNQNRQYDVIHWWAGVSKAAPSVAMAAQGTVYDNAVGLLKFKDAGLDWSDGMCRLQGAE